MYLVYLLLSFLVSSSAFAQTTGSSAEPVQCLAQEDIKRLTSIFRIAVESNPDLCDAKKSYSYRLLEALLFAEKLQLTGPVAPAPWNQNILPTNWLSYLKKLSPVILGGSSDPTGNTCLENSSYLAYVTDWVPETMFVCKSLFQEKFGAGDILQVLMHEARHHQGYSHVYCRTKLKAGSSNGCDESIYQKGSYAVSVESYVKIGVSATNIDPATRESARYSALLWAESSLNQKVVKEQSYVLLTDLDNQTFQFNGTELKPLLSDLRTAGVFYRRQEKQVVFLPDDKTQAAQLFNTADGLRLKRVADEGTYMADYAKWSSEERALLKDFYWEDNVSARMSGNKIEVTYMDDKQKNTSIEWTNGTFVSFLTNADLGVNYTKRLYAINEQGQVFRIELLDAGQSRITKTNIEFPELRQMATFAGQSFRLNRDGQILRKNKVGWFEIEALKNKRFKSISRPLSGSPELNWLYE